MKRLKDSLRNWLGINELDSTDRIMRYKLASTERRLNHLEELSFIGVDVGAMEESESYIVIASKIKGGIVKIIPMRHETPSTTISLMKDLESRYGIKKEFKDLPKGMRF